MGRVRRNMKTCFTPTVNYLDLFSLFFSYSPSNRRSYNTLQPSSFATRLPTPLLCLRCGWSPPLLRRNSKLQRHLNLLFVMLVNRIGCVVLFRECGWHNQWNQWQHAPCFGVVETYDIRPIFSERMHRAGWTLLWAANMVVLGGPFCVRVLTLETCANQRREQTREPSVKIVTYCDGITSKERGKSYTYFGLFPPSGELN